jgi:hypothetical protein
MAVSVGGIIINVIMVLIIIAIVVVGIVFNNELTTCEQTPNQLCYQIQCPCDVVAAPCFGYSSRPGPQPNTFYCASAPSTLVNADGSTA